MATQEDFITTKAVKKDYLEFKTFVEEKGIKTYFALTEAMSLWIKHKNGELFSKEDLKSIYNIDLDNSSEKSLSERFENWGFPEYNKKA